MDFLLDADFERTGGWTADGDLPGGITPESWWTGKGNPPLQVALAKAPSRPTRSDARSLWKSRHGAQSPSVLLVVAYPTSKPARALVCGPEGDTPRCEDLTLDHAERLARAALAEADRHQATRFLVDALDTEHGPQGLRNAGLLSTHHLTVGVPQRPDWPDAVERGKNLLNLRDRELISELGFTIERQGPVDILKTADGYTRAVAVLLHSNEQEDAPSPRFDAHSPLAYALTQAKKSNIPYIVSVRSGNVRLYGPRLNSPGAPTPRSDVYVELKLALLNEEQAGYVPLLLSADALAPGGTYEDIAEASADFAALLGERLRDRVYDEVVPALALAVTDEVGGTDAEALDLHYRTALTILFRLLFIAYAEDSQLLPYHLNTEYSRKSLKQMARDLADDIDADRPLGFEYRGRPADPDANADTSTELWDACTALFGIVDKGNTRLNVPPYNGGLFSADPEVNPLGGIIENLDLPNATFGPAITSLLVDETPDGDVGPVDFRSLSVRDFGTIYEGLLESELAAADQDLTIDADDTYVPAEEDDEVWVEEGAVYLHDRSGARKATGSYFTKPFAVEHLLNHALQPTFDEHLADIAQLVDDGKLTEAADRLFDFRVADIAMGSGHFLTAAVDRLAESFTAFLAEHPIQGVTAELETLRQAAISAMGSLADKVEVETSDVLRRLVARRCIYGADLNPISVELARVSVWIHTFVPGLPLSFLDHNLVVGNSLTGIATLDEAIDGLEEQTERQGGALSLGRVFIENALSDAEEPLRRLANIADATRDDITAARRAHQEARAAVDPVEDLMNVLVAARLGEVDPPDPDTDDLLDLDDSLVETASQVARQVRALHFPTAFPEVFLRDSAGFDVILGNPPWDKVKVESLVFWGRHSPGLRALPQRDKDREIERLVEERPDLVARLTEEKQEAERMRDIIGSGPYELGAGDTELARVFAWRFWHLMRPMGRFGVVFPRAAVLSAPGMEPWRRQVLREGAFEDVCLLTNNGHWAFDDVDVRYTVALVTARRGGDTHTVSLEGPHRSMEDYQAGRSTPSAEMSAEEFKQLSSTAAFPVLGGPEDLPVVLQMLRHPKFGDEDRTDWFFRPVRETETDRNKEGGWLFEYVEEQPDNTVPIYTGASFNLWEPETGEVYAWADVDEVSEHLYEKRQRQANHSRSAFYGFPEDEIEDPKTLPMYRPRVAFRDVARATDSRTLIAALLPPRVVPHEKAPYLLPVRGGPREEAYVLGVVASRVFDWLMRQQVENKVSFTLLNDQPVPAPSADHPGRLRVIEIAGRLAALDGRYAEWAKQVGVPVGSVGSEEEEQRLLAELDACVARLYGLAEDDLRHLYSTFHRTWDHEPFMEAVIDVFRELDFEPAEVPA